VCLHGQVLLGGAGKHELLVHASRRNYAPLVLADHPLLEDRLRLLCRSKELRFDVDYWGCMSAGIEMNGAILFLFVCMPTSCVMPWSCSLTTRARFCTFYTDKHYKIGDYVDWGEAPPQSVVNAVPIAGRTIFSLGRIMAFYVCFKGCHGVVHNRRGVQVAWGQPRPMHVFLLLRRVELYPKCKHMYVMAPPPLVPMFHRDHAACATPGIELLHVGDIGWQVQVLPHPDVVNQRYVGVRCWECL
jgi:hypothetical protein